MNLPDGSSQRLGPVVESDVVTLRIGEGKITHERTVDGSRDDRIAIAGESVMNNLDIGGRAGVLLTVTRA